MAHKVRRVLSKTGQEVVAVMEQDTERAKELVRLASNKIKTRTYTNVEFNRENTAQITLPLEMSYDHAIDWMQRQKEAEERVVSYRRQYDAYPLDGARALKIALERIYGFADLMSVQTMFGKKPPMKIEIDLGNGEREIAPWGPIQPLGIDGVLSPSYETEPEMKFILTAEVRQKDEKAMQAITDLVQHVLDTDSIYRGRAFRLNFDWLGVDEPNPLQMQPKVMPLSNLTMNDLIVSDLTRFSLETDLLLRLEAPSNCIQAGVPLKQGILFAGPYGTGKTLAAKIAANIATDNGWTFIYLDDPSHFARAIRLATHYAPSVVFVEDIDKVTSGERTEQLNEILNTIDGIDTKHAPIITVLTTNHADHIQKGFLRAGRIDSIIEFGAPDIRTALRFVNLYCRDAQGINLIAPLDSEDELLIGRELNGMVPAFIAEVCRKAVLRAMYRLERAPLQGDVTAEDLYLAAKSMRAHAQRADEFGLIAQQ